MTRAILISAALLISSSLWGCASTNNSTANTSQKLGTVIQKDTIITQPARRSSPIDIGIGLGGGGNIGWGVNLGLGRLFELAQPTTQTVFQYKIKMAENESLMIQSAQDFGVGSCLTVLERAGDRNFPQIQGNPSCQKPVSQ